MTFIDFCKVLGVVIETLPPIGQWKRYPTTEHPSKKNASVRYNGDHGHVCNFETGEDAHLWRPESDDAPVIDHEAIKRVQQEEARRIQAGYAAAAKKAGYVMHQCSMRTHPYMASKGFPDERVNVWDDQGVKKMIVPMRVGQALVNVQQIYQETDEVTGEPACKDDGSPRFTKKFLYQGRSRDAEFVMDNHGIDVLAEGLATAYSVRAAMASIKMKYKLHVTFSAANTKRIAAGLQNGILVVDHDTKIPTGQTMPTGQRVAKEVGWPMWISETPGFDFNDHHREVGLFRASQSLRAVIMEAQRQQRVRLK